jgi:hypothetical protein
MLLKSTPNRVVTMRMRRMGKIRNVPLFRFDEKGEYNYPADKWDKLSNTDQNKLYRHFGIKPLPIEEKSLKTDLNDTMPYSELKTYAKSLGINTYGMKREEIELAIKGR